MQRIHNYKKFVNEPVPLKLFKFQGVAKIHMGPTSGEWFSIDELYSAASSYGGSIDHGQVQEK